MEILLDPFPHSLRDAQSENQMQNGAPAHLNFASLWMAVAKLSVSNGRFSETMRSKSWNAPRGVSASLTKRQRLHLFIYSKAINIQ